MLAPYSQYPTPCSICLAPHSSALQSRLKLMRDMSLYDLQQANANIVACIDSMTMLIQENYVNAPQPHKTDLKYMAEDCMELRRWEMHLVKEMKEREAVMEEVRLLQEEADKQERVQERMRKDTTGATTQKLFDAISEMKVTVQAGVKEATQEIQTSEMEEMKEMAKRYYS